MLDSGLNGKIVLVTGAARRIGRALALAAAGAGADIIVHDRRGGQAAAQTQQDIIAMGRRAWIVKADLGRTNEVEQMADQAAEIGTLYGLVNSAAIFERPGAMATSVGAWERHMAVNLRAPFILSQAFARQVPENGQGRIVNILDWRALRPGPDHFAYTISKAALAAMTQSLAVALAPNISVTGLALGAILPPDDRPAPANILERVPLRRWGELSEIESALIFLLAGPAYITGEILHVDGGRHLT